MVKLLPSSYMAFSQAFVVNITFCLGPRDLKPMAEVKYRGLGTRQVKLITVYLVRQAQHLHYICQNSQHMTTQIHQFVCLEVIRK